MFIVYLPAMDVQLELHSAAYAIFADSIRALWNFDNQVPAQELISLRSITEARYGIPYATHPPEA